MCVSMYMCMCVHVYDCYNKIRQHNAKQSVFLIWFMSSTPKPHLDSCFLLTISIDTARILIDYKIRNSLPSTSTCCSDLLLDID